MVGGVSKANISALTHLVEVAAEEVAAAAATTAAKLVEPSLAPRTAEPTSSKADLAPAPAGNYAGCLDDVHTAAFVRTIAVLDLRSPSSRKQIADELAKHTVEIG